MMHILRFLPSFLLDVFSPAISVKVLGLALWDFVLAEALSGSKNDPWGDDAVASSVEDVSDSCCWSIWLVSLLFWGGSLAFFPLGLNSCFLPGRGVSLIFFVNDFF